MTFGFSYKKKKTKLKNVLSNLGTQGQQKKEYWVESEECQRKRSKM